MQAPSLDIDIWARLCAALDGNTAAVRDSEARKQKMASAVSYISAPALQFAGSALPVDGRTVNFGPRTGFNWAVQRLVIAGLGTADYVTAYRGQGLAGAVAVNALYTFTVAVAGAVATWHPGRTGLLLLGRENPTLMFGGSSSVAKVTVSADVIQVTDEQLPYFLL